MYRTLLFFVCICLLILKATGQDTLPDFKIIHRGSNRVFISWVNPYGNTIHQLSIQRSAEPSRNFRTILTLPDPSVPQNGFVDSKAADNRSFYRLYILLDSGRYVFSKVKRPVLDTSRIVAEPAALAMEEKPELNPANDNKEEQQMGKTPSVKAKEIPERIIFVKKRDTLIAEIRERSIKRYKDSVAIKTKDTISYNTPDTLIIRPFVPKEVFKPSRFIFTDKEGNVKMVLPDADTKKYAVRFLDEDNSLLFEIKKIASTDLTIDKTNFLRAGWFKFELFEDEQLKEKNKLYLSKQF
jgi:hypothetical protein